MRPNLDSFRRVMDPYNFSRLGDIFAEAVADARRSTLDEAAQALQPRIEKFERTAREGKEAGVLTDDEYSALMSSASMYRECQHIVRFLKETL